MTERLLLTTDAIGGVWQYSVELAEALATSGTETVLAVLGPETTSEQRHHVAALPGVDLIETGLPIDWLCDDPAPVLAAGKAIAALARETGADVVQLNTPALAAAGRLPVPTVAVGHGCVTTWWQAGRGEDPAPDFAWHREISRRGLSLVDRVVAPSAAHAGAMQRAYGLATLPTVIHNGRRPPAAASTGAPVREALTIGRLWDEVKNTALLDRVAARIDAPFVAIGAVRGPHGEAIAIDHLSLPGHVTEAEVARHLARRPVFVSAAKFEPFGLAVLEAAQAGCALVLADIATFRELWNGAARFVAGDDPAAWAAAIGALLDHAEVRSQLGRAAQQRAASYTPGATAAAMRTLYREVAAEREARRAA